ncbi:MAG: hypothetical protein EA400_10960 [Chromatiaceae bacterium]|nr:MAG: hypothetical protein EA400_10960 [Chromatiaceae bacterium]
MPAPCPVRVLRFRSCLALTASTPRVGPRTGRAAAALTGSLGLSLVTVLLTTGCGMTADWTRPLAGRPTEAGFLALVQAHCSDFSVGEHRLGDLLANDQLFQDLTARLFQGDLSGDEYLNQILALHPAADANVPATGCVLDQLQTCQLGPCEVTEPSAPVAATVATPVPAPTVPPEAPEPPLATEPAPTPEPLP